MRRLWGFPQLPRRIERGAYVDFFPAHAPFSKWPEDRHPHCHFRGLLRLHTCYGPLDCSAAQGCLCREAPVPASYPDRPLASF